MLGDRAQPVCCRDDLSRQLIGPGDNGVDVVQRLEQLGGAIRATDAIGDDLATGSLEPRDVAGRCFAEGARPDQHAPTAHRHAVPLKECPQRIDLLLHVLDLVESRAQRQGACPSGGKLGRVAPVNTASDLNLECGGSLPCRTDAGQYEGVEGGAARTLPRDPREEEYGVDELQHRVEKGQRRTQSEGDARPDPPISDGKERLIEQWRALDVDEDEVDAGLDQVRHEPERLERAEVDFEGQARPGP